MKAEIKAKWLAALRSGEYEQTRHQLVKLSNEKTSYCCLGVLANVLQKDFPEIMEKASTRLDIDDECIKSELDTDYFIRYTGTIPETLSEMIEMKEECEVYYSLNDSEGLNFIDIAKVIEEKE